MHTHKPIKEAEEGIRIMLIMHYRQGDNSNKYNNKMQIIIKMNNNNNKMRIKARITITNNRLRM